MRKRLIWNHFSIACFLTLFLFSTSGDWGSSALAAGTKGSFDLILPYTDITVGQGQDVSMDAEVVNRTKNPVQVGLTIESIPKAWTVNFHSRYPSFPVRSVMVQGKKSTTVEFKAKIPKTAKPGKYQVKITSKDTNGTTRHVEQVTFRVTTKTIQTGGLTLTSQYPVLSGPTGHTFKFSVDLKNDTGKPLTAALAAEPPAGWAVRFKPQFGDTQISSIALKADATETLSVEADSPVRGEPGDYPLTVKARSGALEASSKLKMTLKGTYDLKMGFASGTLNTSITAGKKEPVDFLVANSGSAPIHNLSFVTQKPAKWTVEFKPNKLKALKPEELREVKMEIMAPPRTIAGDYLLTLTSNSPDATKSIDLRVTVSTPTLWAWIGVLIVVLVVLGLGIVFVRLGRR
ncbi:MAG: NEW3 domain-containing protein [Candidatus Binatia bacterium]